MCADAEISSSCLTGERVVEGELDSGTNVLAEGQQHRWRLLDDSLWTQRQLSEKPDPALAVLRTLFDQPRWVDPSYLYDDRGSDLFEEVSQLPEYYLTRLEDGILEQEAANIVAAAPVECLVELGAGFSKKTRHLLREQVRQRGRGIFAPVDVSSLALTGSREAQQEAFPEIQFQGLVARYEDAIASIDNELPTLFVFLGSTVGNFTRVQFGHFFHQLSSSMGPNDFLLLGVDEVKEAEIVERAYNDSRGLTAAFVLNAFEHINRLTGSNFERAKMEYSPLYNSQKRQMEMYALSTSSQEIRFPEVEASFQWEEAEPILLEISRKFVLSSLLNQLQLFGLELVERYNDSQQWFSVLLLRRSP